MEVNGYPLSATQQKYINFIAKWTIPHLIGNRERRIEIASRVTWWSLREGVLSEPNAFAYSNYDRNVPKTDQPLFVGGPGVAWQVGIAAGQVPNYELTGLEREAIELYKPLDPSITIQKVLGNTAVQAGYMENSSIHNAIVASTGYLRASWLLRNHLVGFTVIEPQEVYTECIVQGKHWCFTAGYTDADHFGSNSMAMKNSIRDLTNIYGALVH